MLSASSSLRQAGARGWFAACSLEGPFAGNRKRPFHCGQKRGTIHFRVFEVFQFTVLLVNCVGKVRTMAVPRMAR